MCKHFIGFIIMALSFTSSTHASLPDGFVYVKDVIPTIIESMNYASDQNFIGRPLSGYKKPRAILPKEVADALSKVQEEFLKDGYTIVIYDAYRPQKTVDEFGTWSQDIHDLKMKHLYYPRINKADAFEIGYLAKRSQHSKGSAVDLSIIEIGKTPHKPSIKYRKLKDGFDAPFLDDGTLDMGTSFDLFDEASFHDSPIIEAIHSKNRDYLRAKMLKHGFNDYKKEWWHYSLKNEPFPDTYFDFDVE